MRRLLALTLISCSVALGGVAGVGSPTLAAAAGTGKASGVTSPTLGLTTPAQSVTAPATQTTVPATTTTSTGGGLSGTDGVLIAVIALLVLGGIAFFIWRDARGVAKSIGHHASDDTEFAGKHSGSKAPRKTRKPKPAERKRRKRGRAPR